MIPKPDAATRMMGMCFTSVIFYMPAKTILDFFSIRKGSAAPGLLLK
jgi:hypothetical protein